MAAMMTHYFREHLKSKSIHFCVWLKYTELCNSSLPLKGKQQLLSPPLVSFVVREGRLFFSEELFSLFEASTTSFPLLMTYFVYK